MAKYSPWWTCCCDRSLGSLISLQRECHCESQQILPVLCTYNYDASSKIVFCCVKLIVLSVYLSIYTINTWWHTASVKSRIKLVHQVLVYMIFKLFIFKLLVNAGYIEVDFKSKLNYQTHYQINPFVTEANYSEHQNILISLWVELLEFNLTSSSLLWASRYIDFLLSWITRIQLTLYEKKIQFIFSAWALKWVYKLGFFGIYKAYNVTRLQSCVQLSTR